MKKDEIYYNPEGSPVVPQKYDVRVQLRYRSRGLINDKELQAHLKSLPDDTANADFVDYEAVISDEKEAGAPVGLTH